MEEPNGLDTSYETTSNVTFIGTIGKPESDVNNNNIISLNTQNTPANAVII